MKRIYGILLFATLSSTAWGRSLETDTVFRCGKKSTYSVSLDYLRSKFEVETDAAGTEAFVAGAYAAKLKITKTAQNCEIEIQELNGLHEAHTLTYGYALSDGISGMKLLRSPTSESVSNAERHCDVMKAYQATLAKCELPKIEEALEAMNCEASLDGKSLRTVILSDGDYKNFERKIYDDGHLIERKPLTVESRAGDGCRVTMRQPVATPKRDFLFSFRVSPDLKVAGRVEKSVIPVRGGITVPEGLKNVSCQVEEGFSKALQGCAIESKAFYEDQGSAAASRAGSGPSSSAK
jgi:hypothetical protein